MHRTVIAIALASIICNSLLGPERANGDESTPVPTSLPVAEAPFGLEAVALPATRRGVAEFFACLPDEVNGEAHHSVNVRPDGRVVASYGEPDPRFGPPLTLQALNFEAGDFFPRDFTAGQYVASTAQHADAAAIALGRDGDVVWIRAETTAGVAGDHRLTPEVVRPLYYLAWGEVDSPWLFTAAAFTPEGLAALATSFVMTGASTTPHAGC